MSDSLQRHHQHDRRSFAWRRRERELCPEIPSPLFHVLQSIAPRTARVEPLPIVLQRDAQPSGIDADPEQYLRATRMPDRVRDRFFHQQEQGATPLHGDRKISIQRRPTDRDRDALRFHDISSVFLNAQQGIVQRIVGRIDGPDDVMQRFLDMPQIILDTDGKIGEPGCIPCQALLEHAVEDRGTAQRGTDVIVKICGDLHPEMVQTEFIFHTP